MVFVKGYCDLSKNFINRLTFLYPEMQLVSITLQHEMTCKRQNGCMQIQWTNRELISIIPLGQHHMKLQGCEKKLVLQGYHIHLPTVDHTTYLLKGMA